MADSIQLPLFSAAHNASMDAGNGWQQGQTLQYYHNSQELRAVVIHALIKEIEHTPQSPEQRVVVSQNRLNNYAPMYENGEETWFTSEHFTYLFSTVFGLSPQRGWEVVRNSPEVQRVVREIIAPPDYEDESLPIYSPGQPPSYPTALRQPIHIPAGERIARTIVLGPSEADFAPEEARVRDSPMVPNAIGQGRPTWVESTFLHGYGPENPDSPLNLAQRLRSRHVHFANVPNIIPEDANNALGIFFSNQGGAADARWWGAATAEFLGRRSGAPPRRLGSPPPPRTSHGSPTAPQLPSAAQAHDSHTTSQVAHTGNGSSPITPPTQTGIATQDPRRAHGLRRNNTTRPYFSPQLSPPQQRWRPGPNGTYYPAAPGEAGYTVLPLAGARAERLRPGVRRPDEWHRNGHGQNQARHSAPPARIRTASGRVRKGSDESDGPARNLRSRKGSP